MFILTEFSFVQFIVDSSNIFPLLAGMLSRVYRTQRIKAYIELAEWMEFGLLPCPLRID
jgi:hypothetical protein